MFLKYRTSVYYIILSFYLEINEKKNSMRHKTLSVIE